jgi:phage-related baseplate assembly protein
MLEPTRYECPADFMPLHKYLSRADAVLSCAARLASRLACEAEMHPTARETMIAMAEGLALEAQAAFCEARKLIVRHAKDPAATDLFLTGIIDVDPPPSTPNRQPSTVNQEP